MSLGLQLDAFNFDEAQGPTEDPLLAGLLMMPIEMQIHEVSLSLMRHHIGKASPNAASTAVLSFEKFYPRTANSISNKRVLWKLLGISPNNGSYNDSVSVLQNLTGDAKTASAVVCQFIQRSCNDPAFVSVIASLLNVPVQPSDDALGKALSLDVNPRRSFLEMLVEYHLTCGSQMGHDTFSTPKPFAIDHLNNEIEVNGVRIGATSSSPSFIAKLSDFDLEHAQVLGRGAGGSVMRALHRPSNTFMAVKTISIDDSNTGQVVSELSVVWGITDANGCKVERPQSPFLIKCYGVFYDQGVLFIVMEQMDGSLKDLITKVGDTYVGISEKVCRAVAFQALHGLAFMHSTLKQLHRDIKPHNILFRKSDGAVKISDFGISSSAMESIFMKKKSTFCGTLRYMSPLVVEDPDYGHEADLWSFGVSLLQLALGDLPYKGDSPFSIMQLKSCPPRLPARAPSGEPFSPEFGAFIEHVCDSSSVPNEAIALLRHPWFRGLTIEESRKIIATM